MCSKTKCYTFVEDMGRSWINAKAHCVNLGGELLQNIQQAQIDMEAAIDGRMCTESEKYYWIYGISGMCGTM